jgi:hypothetical protein
MKSGIFIIFSLLYFGILLGLLYLSYSYIKYVNDLQKKKCGCSEDVKREMVKNFSYVILVSWILLIIVMFVVPPSKFIGIVNSNLYFVLQFLIIVGYAYLLFTYSKKLIDESCECSESWVREAMQYQSYVYIFISFFSLLFFLLKLLINKDNSKELITLIKAMKK